MRRTILLIDDDRSLAEMYSQVFQQNGYAMMWADNGKQALQLFKNKTFDLIILDINMSGMDGYEVIKEIRSVNNVIHVWFLTGRKDWESSEKCFKLGGDDFIRKELGINGLILKMNNFFLKKTEIKTERKIYITPDTYLDTFESCLYVYGQALKLTDYEYSFLHFLVLNINNQLKKDALKDYIWWDKSNDVYCLNKCMTKIRKPIEKDKRIKLISIRGSYIMLKVEEEE